MPDAGVSAVHVAQTPNAAPTLTPEPDPATPAPESLPTTRGASTFSSMLGRTAEESPAPATTNPPTSTPMSVDVVTAPTRSFPIPSKIPAGGGGWMEGTSVSAGGGRTLAAAVKEPVRVIAHIDMDAFYAQIEQVRDQALTGKPVVVVQYPTTMHNIRDMAPDDVRVVDGSASSLIAVSYEARKFGVKRGMKAGEAQKLCEDLVLVQVPTRNGKADISLYRDNGEKVVDVLECAGGTLTIVEKASIDEVYVDVTLATQTLLASVIRHASPCLVETGTTKEDTPRVEQLNQAEVSLHQHEEPSQRQLEEEILQEGEGLQAKKRPTFQYGGNGKVWEEMGKGGWETVLRETTGTHTAGMDDDGSSETQGVSWWSRPQEAFSEDDKLLACGAAVVSRLRAAVRSELNYSCTAGLAHNKLLAKLCSNMHKPNAQTVLPSSRVEKVFHSLPVGKVKGWGGKLGVKITEKLGVSTAGEVAAVGAVELQRVLGVEDGWRVWQKSNGVDKEPVTARSQPKSIGCSKTFPGKAKLTSMTEIGRWLSELAKELVFRLKDHKQKEGVTPTKLTVSFAESHNEKGLPKAISRCCRMVDIEVTAIVEACSKMVRSYKLEMPALNMLGLSTHTFEEIGEKTTRRIESFFAAKSSKDEKAASTDTNGNSVQISGGGERRHVEDASPMSVYSSTPSPFTAQNRNGFRGGADLRERRERGTQGLEGVGGLGNKGRKRRIDDDVLGFSKVDVTGEDEGDMSGSWSGDAVAAKRRRMREVDTTAIDRNEGTQADGVAVKGMGRLNGRFPDDGENAVKATSTGKLTFPGADTAGAGIAGTAGAASNGGDAIDAEGGESSAGDDFYDITLAPEWFYNGRDGSRSDADDGRTKKEARDLRESSEGTDLRQSRQARSGEGVDFIEVEKDQGQGEDTTREKGTPTGLRFDLGVGNPDVTNGLEGRDPDPYVKGSEDLDGVPSNDVAAAAVRAAPARSFPVESVEATAASPTDSSSVVSRGCGAVADKILPAAGEERDAMAIGDRCMEAELKRGEREVNTSPMEANDDDGDDVEPRPLLFGKGGRSGVFGEVDPDVLAELPMEIQREVWMQQGGQGAPSLARDFFGSGGTTNGQGVAVKSGGAGAAKLGSSRGSGRKRGRGRGRGTSPRRGKGQGSISSFFGK